MISPAFDEEQAIVFGVDNKYLKYLYVLIKSIVDTSIDTEKYDIVIFHTCTDSTRMNDISNLQKENISIRFVDVWDTIKDHDLYISRHLSIATYYRIFIPQILTKYRKAIYLDTDVIVLDNINNLFNMELNGHWLGVMPNMTSPTVHGYRRYLDKKNFYRHKYFNTGVLVLDLDKLREINFTQLCLDKAVELGDTNEGHDNDLICMLCYQHVQRLDLNWHCPANMIDPTTANHEFFSRYIPFLFGDEVEDFWTNPKLIHYVGPGPYKPWNNRNSSLLMLTDKWWDVAKTTPYYEEFCKELEEYIWPDGIINYIHPEKFYTNKSANEKLKERRQESPFLEYRKKRCKVYLKELINNF